VPYRCITAQPSAPISYATPFGRLSVPPSPALTHGALRVRSRQVDMDCANMNFDNTIFAFTRIMWLANPTKTLSALVADWPCRAVLTEFVKTCSVVFEGHFEFFVQVRFPWRVIASSPLQSTEQVFSCSCLIQSKHTHNERVTILLLTKSPCC